MHHCDLFVLLGLWFAQGCVDIGAFKMVSQIFDTVKGDVAVRLNSNHFVCLFIWGFFKAGGEFFLSCIVSGHLYVSILSSSIDCIQICVYEFIIIHTVWESSSIFLFYFYKLKLLEDCCPSFLCQ